MLISVLVTLALPGVVVRAASEQLDQIATPRRVLARSVF